MFFFKKKTTKEKIAAKKVNSSGERTDRLDAEGNLPFGWVVYNQKYVDMIHNEEMQYVEKIRNAEGVVDELNALHDYMRYLEEGMKKYKKMQHGCVGKYFEVYICDSCATHEYKKRLDYMEKNIHSLLDEERKEKKAREEYLKKKYSKKGRN